MKILLIYFLTFLLLGCSHEEISKTEIPNIYGQWKGSGTFYNFNFNKEYGPLAFNIQINPDGSITGTIENQLYSIAITDIIFAVLFIIAYWLTRHRIVNVEKS